jgi:hypothetical protein
MKKLIALVLITLSATAMAQHHHHRHGGWGYNGWIAPVIVSGVIGYEIARRQSLHPVIVLSGTTSCGSACSILWALAQGARILVREWAANHESEISSG